MPITCTRCRIALPNNTHFCPNCGAQTWAGTTPYDLYTTTPKHFCVGKANDDLHAKWVQQYKGNMGFSHNEHNFVHVIFSLKYQNGRAGWADKFINHDQSKLTPWILLSIEPNGLLMIGLRAEGRLPIWHKISTRFKEQYCYYFNRRNGFIPQRAIKSLDYYKKDMCKILTVTTSQQTYTFRIYPVWDYRAFQSVNYTQVDYYVHRLRLRVEDKHQY